MGDEAALLEGVVMNLLVIDVETTSLEPDEGVMVEIGMAGLDLETGEITCEMDRLIKPENSADLPDDAWVYHNSEPPITPGLIMEQGTFWRKLVKGVMSIVGRYDKVTAYNRQFDVGWLEAYGVSIPLNDLAPCPMLVMTEICRIPHFFGYKWPKFEEAWLEVFGTPIDEPHRAYADAELEARLIYEMIQKGIYHA
jgi:DNA polymerase III epsilon subunit-like protein